jgi:hypothetical protein
MVGFWHPQLYKKIKLKTDKQEFDAPWKNLSRPGYKIEESEFNS